MQRKKLGTKIVSMAEAIKISGKIQRTKKSRELFHDIEIEVEEFEVEPNAKIASVTFYKLVKKDT